MGTTAAPRPSPTTAAAARPPRTKSTRRSTSALGGRQHADDCSDLDGNGTTDLTTSSTIVHNADGEHDHDPEPHQWRWVIAIANGDESECRRLQQDHAKRCSMVTVATTWSRRMSPSSAPARPPRQSPIKSGNGTKLDQTVTSWSADGKTRSTSIDSDGDGHFDQVETVAVVERQFGRHGFGLFAERGDAGLENRRHHQLERAHPDAADRRQW